MARIDTLKFDVEGSEIRRSRPFFRAAPKVLWPRRILIEIAPAANRQGDCVAFMLANGYRQIWSDGDDALLELG